MRAISLAAILLVGAAAATFWPPCGKQALAITGCCKERGSLDGRWRDNGQDLEQCKRSNERDRDNVFDQSGYVWWDLKCG